MRRFSGIAVIGLGLAGVFILVGVLPSGGSDEGQSGSAVQAASAATSSAAAVESRRLAGANRFETAAMVARERMPVDASELYVATGVNFPDALAAGAAAGLKGAPVVLTADAVPDATRAEIERIDPSDVYVTGGPAAVSEQAAQQIDGLTGAAVHRLAGSERMATAAALAEDAFSAPVPVAYIATGAQFADALAGGAAAAVEDGPLLLTADDHVPKPTQSALSRLQPERIVVLGGTAAVSDSVADELASLTDGSVERRAGSNRFATAVQVSRSAFDEAGTVYLATGEDFPDALAGAPAAAVNAAPLLLVGHGLLPDEVAAELERLAPCTVITLGGAAAISDEVEDHAVAAAQRGADDQGGCTGDAGADDERPDQDRQPVVSCDEVHHVVTGDQPDGFTVPAGECWEIEGEVTTPENVVVRGGLKMRSGSTLTFRDVEEGTGPGDAHDVVDDEVGLWVVGSGMLDVQGSAVEAWNRSGDHETWEPDHEFVRAPHGDEDGPQLWSLGDPVPCTSYGDEELCAEVVNRSRDVMIQGTEAGHAHVFILSDQPQIIRYATIRYVGIDDGEGPTGAYGLHFHRMGDGSRGSVVEGVIVEHAGSHAFVPHASHGIRFVDTVALHTVNSAYWWDPDSRDTYPHNATFDVRYERSLALDVQDGYQTNNELAGFYLGQGENMSCIECVAADVGTRSSGRHRESSGFYAPRSAQSMPNVWELRDIVSHHNRQGMFTRRNRTRLADNFPPEQEGRVDGITAYSNRESGVLTGPYRDNWSVFDARLFDNATVEVQHRSASGGGGVADPDNTFTGLMDAAGDSHVVALRSASNSASESHPVVWRDLTLTGWSTAPVYVDIGSPRRNHDFIEVDADGRDLEPEDFTVNRIGEQSRVRVQRSDGTAFAITHEGVESIDPFHVP